MAEYIDKVELKKAMYHESFEKDSELQRWDSGCWIRYKLFENVVESIPVADVQPVKHGRWISDNPQYLLSHCSECQCFNSIEYKWKYCPNCGAKMDGES